METSASPRVLLVTGTSSGIGLSVAVAAAAAGWTTVATMRDTGRAQALRAAAEAAGVELDVLALDVTDTASVGAAVATVQERYGRLDALVNNAGAAMVGTLETLEVDDFRRAMEINFFGVVQLTRAVMPLLRASGGRVVTVSSVGGIVGQPFNDAYCAAKFAVEGFLESLQPVARTVGVSVCVVEPGAVATEFVANAKIDPAEALAEAGPYAPALGAYLERTRTAFDPANAQTPEQVARVIVELLDAEEPPFRVQTSESAGAFVGIKLADLDGSAVTGLTAGWVAS
ncbi:SDR family NAD(P)-dependent oxidoreductase [Herbiconiux solani]|uniref:SDR family NAD(P)-dependent oxidoreductase n=1 Tax=Herbiconiux solani TaxID=661329 RepID=UPI000825989F|nr:SDR family NAD(P)-dependent oxidoreductase [Herbiconiux solani]